MFYLVLFLSTNFFFKEKEITLIAFQYPIFPLKRYNDIHMTNLFI